MNQPTLFPQPEQPAFDWTATCPKCGYKDGVENFDVLGADQDNLFCPVCQTEFLV